MATISREPIGTLHEKLIIKIEKEEFLPVVDKKLKEFAKKATIPGFRKGMVPTGMIKKMYGNSILMDEVAHLISHEMEKYFKETDLQIFAQPKLISVSNEHNDINNPSNMDYTFEIGLKPDFDVYAVINNARLTKYKINVNDSMLNNEIERLQKQHAKSIEKEVAENDTDFVEFVSQQCDEDGILIIDKKSVDSKFEYGKLPLQFQDLLKNKKINEPFIFDISSIEHSKEVTEFILKATGSEYSIENKNFILTIQKIYELIPAEIDADFFEKVYPGKQLILVDDFKKELTAELELNFNRICNDKLENDIFEHLIHETPIQFPEQFLKNYLIEQEKEKLEEHDFEKKFSTFLHQLRWEMISEKIMKDYNISVSKEDVAAGILSTICAYFGVKNMEDAPWLESYVTKLMNDEKTVNENYHRILNDRIFKQISGMFTMDVKEIEEEEFYQLNKNSHHHH